MHARECRGRFYLLTFDITANTDDVDYEFRSREYADEFARLNDASVS